MKDHIKVLKKIITDLEAISEGRPFIKKIKPLVSIASDDLELQGRILYSIISFYLIDEITLQPTEKYNFVDMSSYYYRSESFSMSFPEYYRRKYRIIQDHIKRKNSLFFTYKNYINNTLNRANYHSIGEIGYIYGQDVNLKIPTSRQELLIEFFKETPNDFYKYFKSSFSIEKSNLDLIKHRFKNKYANFLLNRIENKPKSQYYNQKLEYLLNTKEEYILTSSGTAANLLVSLAINTNQKKKFIHKYWYYENLEEKDQTLYFSEILGKETDFDSFFICTEQSNYIDADKPQYFEDVKEHIKLLIQKLKNKPNKNFTLVLDITSTPDLELGNIPKNIEIIKTLSLSKYQEGLNTNFAGLVISSSQRKKELALVVKEKGLELSNTDYRFLFVPSIEKFVPRIKHIREFCSKIKFSYKGWLAVPVGLSVIIVPDNKTFVSFKKNFQSQTRYTDREFSWLIRDKINLYIKNSNLDNLYFGDSFLFKDSRINIQGPEIQKNGKTFKLRFPRISPGYEIKNQQYSEYKKLGRFLVDLYLNEYSKL